MTTALQSQAEPAPSGLVHVGDDGAAVLVGSICTNCNTTYFPAHALCVRCLTDRAMEPAPLSRQGVIYNYTVVRQSTPGFVVPYVLAYIDLPENVRVLSQIVGVQPEEVQTHLAVELVKVPTTPTPDGAFNGYWNIQGFAFTPVERTKEHA